MKTRVRFSANAMSENDFLVFSGIPPSLTTLNRRQGRGGGGGGGDPETSQRSSRLPEIKLSCIHTWILWSLL